MPVRNVGLHIHGYHFSTPDEWRYCDPSADLRCSYCKELIYRPDRDYKFGSHLCNFDRDHIYVPETKEVFYLCHECMQQDLDLTFAMLSEATQILAASPIDEEQIARARMLTVLSRALLRDIELRVPETRAQKY
jgi:hypothetical protein